MYVSKCGVFVCVCMRVCVREREREREREIMMLASLEMEEGTMSKGILDTL